VSTCDESGSLGPKLDLCHFVASRAAVISIIIHLTTSIKASPSSQSPSPQAQPPSLPYPYLDQHITHTPQSKHSDSPRTLEPRARMAVVVHDRRPIHPPLHLDPRPTSPARPQSYIVRDDLQIFRLAQLRTQLATPLHNGLREFHVWLRRPVVVLSTAAKNNAAAVRPGELPCQNVHCGL
jgi:hypothetical protein